MLRVYLDFRDSLRTFSIYFIWKTSEEISLKVKFYHETRKKFVELFYFFFQIFHFTVSLLEAIRSFWHHKKFWTKENKKNAFWPLILPRISQRPFKSCFFKVLLKSLRRNLLGSYYISTDASNFSKRIVYNRFFQ